MKNLLSSINISGRMKDVARISGGTILGQLISIVALPIYTRIFGASIMGDWALFISVSTIVNTFSDFGLSHAIMIENDEDETLKLFSIITTIVCSISLLVGSVMGCYYGIFQPESEISAVIYAVFIIILIFTQQQIQLSYSWLNRKKEYGILMKNPIINNLSAALIAITLGLMGYKRYGYYIGLIVGQIITLIHMRRNLPHVLFNFNLSEYKKILKKHKEFINYQMPTNIAAQVKNQLPVILLRAFFGSEIVGYYSVSMKVLNIPITFLANAVGKVYYQTVAEMKRKGEKIGEYTLRNINRVTKLAILPMIVLLSFSDIVCTIFLGPNFLIAGQITRIVAFNSFFSFLMMSTQGISIVLKKQKCTFVSAISQIIGYVVGLIRVYSKTLERLKTLDFIAAL